jgi:hypothetical protein
MPVPRTTTDCRLSGSKSGGLGRVPATTISSASKPLGSAADSGALRTYA